MKIINHISKMLLFLFICIVPRTLLSQNVEEMINEEFLPCLEEPAGVQLKKMADAVLWLDERSKDFLSKYDNSDRNALKYLGRATRGVYVGKGSVLDTVNDRTISYVNIALLAFKEVGVINQDEEDEFVKCTWLSLFSGAYRSQNVLFYLTKECSPAGRANRNREFRKRSPISRIIADEKIVYWKKIEQLINKIIETLKATKVDFEDITRYLGAKELPKVNKEDLDNFKDLYSKYASVFLDLEINVDNLGCTLSLINEKAKKFNEYYEEHKSQIQENVENFLNRETMLFPVYMKRSFYVDTGLTLIYTMDRLDMIDDLEEKLFADAIANLQTISRLSNKKYRYKGRQGKHFELKQENLRAQEKCFPDLFKALKTIQDIKNRGLSGWHLRIDFDCVECDVIRENSRLMDLYDLYEDGLLRMDADIPFVIEEIGVEKYIDSMLFLEEKISGYDLREEDINESYELGQKDTVPCICEEMCEKYVHFALVHLLEKGGSISEEQRKILTKNIASILRIEHIMELKHKEYHKKYMQQKNALLPGTAQLLVDIRNYLTKTPDADNDQEEDEL